MCGLRLHVDGRERLPAGAYLLAAAVHRAWIDPLVVLRACPIEPRVWFMGGGPTALDRRWKEWLLRRTGGFLPVWRGGASVETHVEAARAVVQSGAVLGLFFEGGIGGLPDRVARVRIGSGLLALRTNAPIVPFAVCGTGELYRGKRIAARVLPAVTVAELLQAGPGANLPEPNSRAELRLARRISDRLAELIDAELASMYPPTVDPPEVPRRWRWLTRVFR